MAQRPALTEVPMRDETQRDEALATPRIYAIICKNSLNTIHGN